MSQKSLPERKCHAKLIKDNGKSLCISVQMLCFRMHLSLFVLLFLKTIRKQTNNNNKTQPNLKIKMKTHCYIVLGPINPLNDF